MINYREERCAFILLFSISVSFFTPCFENISYNVSHTPQLNVSHTLIDDC